MFDRPRFALLSLSLLVAACSARNLDDYESGTGGSGGGNVGGSAGIAGSSPGGGAAGVSGGGGSGNTGGAGGAGGTGNVGGSGGSVGGGGGTGGSTGGGGGTGGGTSGGGTGGTGGGGTGGGTSGGGTGGGTSGGGTGGGTSGGGTGGTGGGGTSVCGNGVLESGEQCDDSNKNAGDGCNATCQVVCADRNTSAVPYTNTPSNRIHCYWRVGSTNNWQDTSGKCQSNGGGHLATLTSSGENTFVQGLTPSGQTFIWIGGSDGQAESSSTSASYAWVTSEAFGYTNWATGEPNHSSCGTGCWEHRMALRKSDGKWEDRSASDSGDGICEWDPKP